MDDTRSGAALRVLACGATRHTHALKKTPRSFRSVPQCHGCFPSQMRTAPGTASRANGRRAGHAGRTPTIRSPRASRWTPKHRTRLPFVGPTRKVVFHDARAPRRSTSGHRGKRRNVARALSAWKQTERRWAISGLVAGRPRDPGSGAGGRLNRPLVEQQRSTCRPPRHHLKPQMLGARFDSRPTPAPRVRGLPVILTSPAILTSATFVFGFARCRWQRAGRTQSTTSCATFGGLGIIFSLPNVSGQQKRPRVGEVHPTDVGEGTGAGGTPEADGRSCPSGEVCPSHPHDFASMAMVANTNVTTRCMTTTRRTQLIATATRRQPRHRCHRCRNPASCRCSRPAPGRDFVDQPSARHSVKRDLQADRALRSLHTEGLPWLPSPRRKVYLSGEARKLRHKKHKHAHAHTQTRGRQQQFCRTVRMQTEIDTLTNMA